MRRFTCTLYHVVIIRGTCILLYELGFIVLPKKAQLIHRNESYLIGKYGSSSKSVLNHRVFSGLCLGLGQHVVPAYTQRGLSRCMYKHNIKVQRDLRLWRNNGMPRLSQSQQQKQQ